MWPRAKSYIVLGYCCDVVAPPVAQRQHELRRFLEEEPPTLIQKPISRSCGHGGSCDVISCCLRHVVVSPAAAAAAALLLSRRGSSDPSRSVFSFSRLGHEQIKLCFVVVVVPSAAAATGSPLCACGGVGRNDQTMLIQGAIWFPPSGGTRYMRNAYQVSSLTVLPQGKKAPQKKRT